MKKWILLSALIVSALNSSAQLRTYYSQYMLNQGIFNPGYMDITTRFSATLNFRKQWVSSLETPLTFSANGHYHITPNHGVGMVALTDYTAGVNTIEVSGVYNYHIWLGEKTALGLGVKVGYQQRSLQTDYIYFSEKEPTLDNRISRGLNLGVGLSIQSENFDFGVSMPSLFDNALADPSTIYATTYNHFFSHIGYKIRFNDNIIFYPTAMARMVKGSKLNMSFDGNFLFGQLIWVGGGYQSDNGVTGSLGLFLEKGLRIVYSYQTSFYTPHKHLQNTHEVTLNFARSIDDLPFAKRKYTTRKGGQFRKKLR
ncbi:PorP/SprF family type IX secretion system membrane protein [Fluviicola sp.]|uniref:PorP/SprF family type IX secretion system membrane protein n=1 Tax=Fluviicola sp. TaxID=1917219 RepID=UPI0031DC7382